MLLKDLSVKDFVKELGSSSPAPGGGSASNLCINCGIGLIKMACELTIGKKKYLFVQENFEKIKEVCEKLLGYFIDGMDKDADCFNEVMSAYAISKEDPIRKERILKSSINSALYPLKNAEKIVEFLPKVDYVMNNCNVNCKSDAMCGKEMILAGIKGLIYNVIINIDGLEETDQIKDIVKRVENIKNIIK